MRFWLALIVTTIVLMMSRSVASAAPIEGLSNFASRVNDGGGVIISNIQQFAHVFQTDDHTYDLLNYEGVYFKRLAIDDESINEDPRLFGCRYFIDLYETDASLGRGTFVTTIASEVFVTIFNPTVLTFTPSTPITLKPNSFYRIERNTNERICGLLEITENLSNVPTGQFTFLGEQVSLDGGITWNPTNTIHTFRLIVERRDSPLGVFASCIGPDLRVDVVAGDRNFNITADSGDLRLDVPVGSYTFTGPRNETGVTVTEIGGDGQSILLGDFNCFVGNDIVASAVCDGADLRVTIANGDRPYTLTVTTSADVLTSNAQPWGVYTFPGPDIFDVVITEEAGDFESLSFTDITCTAPVVPIAPEVPVIPVSSNTPLLDATALGCVLTQDVLAPNAPDNTYCRVLMRNGGVVSYSGAVPAELIGLGVIFAVDVYRLEGGQSINTFPDYARICLSGTGRYFYMDGRNAPRFSVEMPTEQVDGLTCAWIPAPGTVILTN